MRPKDAIAAARGCCIGNSTWKNDKFKNETTRHASEPPSDWKRKNNNPNSSHQPTTAMKAACHNKQVYLFLSFFGRFFFCFRSPSSNRWIMGKCANVAAARFYAHKLHFVITLLSFYFLQRRFFCNLFVFSLVVSNEQQKKFLFTSLAFQQQQKKEKKWNEMRREKKNEKTDNAVAYGYFIFIKLKIKVSHTHLWACVSGVVLCRVCVCELCVRELCSESGRVIYTCFSICIVRAIRLSTCTVCVIVYLHRILGAAFRINRGICNVHSPIHILHDTLS